MAHRNRFPAVVLIGLALLSPAVPLFFYFDGNWYSILHSYSIGMVFGIFSYSYFLITLMLSARLKFLDRLFGHDRVLVFHRYLATAAFCCAAAHLVFKAIFSLDISFQKAVGIIGFMLFASLLPVASIAMVQGIQHRIAMVRTMKTILLTKLRIDYSTLKLFHNATVVASLLVAVHVLLASSTQENSVRSGVMSLCAAVALGCYVWHKVLRPLRNYLNAFTIERVTPLSRDIVELAFRPSRKPLSRHRAGQFAYIRIFDKACGIEEHPFTLSSDTNGSPSTITVKKLGNYTARLFSVAPGSRVLVDGPYGVFTPHQNGRPKLFIAGGIGITPFFSITSEWDRTGFKQKVTLLWSCRGLEDLVHRDRFEACAERHREFTFVPVVTGTEQRTAYARRIDRSLLETHVIALGRNTLEVFVCGPESLRCAVVKDLRSLGILAKNIHFERFSQ